MTIYIFHLKEHCDRTLSTFANMRSKNLSFHCSY